MLVDLPDDLVLQVLREAADRRLADQPAPPQPDPQYAVPYVAEVLGLDVATVRGYLRLATGDPRRLRYVDTTGKPHGYRVPLSEMRAWQARNLGQNPDELAPTLTRPAGRRRLPRAA